MNSFFRDLTDHSKIILSYLSFLAAIGFGIAGLALPPLGFIHSSVLILIAQLLVLCATLLGLSVKFDLSRKYFHTQQQEGNKDIDEIKQALAEDDKRRKSLQETVEDETTED